MIKKLLVLLVLLSTFSFADDVPSIVSKQVLLNQTSTNQTITLFTPLHSDMYRISFFMEDDTNSSVGFAPFLTYTSVNNVSVGTGATCNTVNGTNTAYCTVLIKPKANTSVTLQIINGASVPDYDLSIVIEHLN